MLVCGPRRMVSGEEIKEIDKDMSRSSVSKVFTCLFILVGLSVKNKY